MPRVRRVRARTAIAAALAVAVLVVVVGAAVDLWRVRRDLLGGQRALSGLSLDSVRAAGGIRPAVDRPVARITRARDLAHHSPFLAALRPVPLVGNQVRAVRDLTDVAGQLGDVAHGAAVAIGHQVDAAGGRPSARIDLLDTVLAQVDRINARLSSVHVGAGGWLLPPLAGARAEVRRKVDHAHARLVESRRSVVALRRFLAGPTRMLVLAANNAEMRGGAGMPLSAGVLTIRDGDLDAGDFTPTSDLFLPHPSGVAGAIPDVLRKTYPRWNLGGDFRETAVTPNFPEVAPVYADMARQTALGPVDGVLEVDAVTLRALLEVIGPVQFEGVTYSAANIEDEILHRNYLRFGDVETTRSARTDLQSRLALTIFDTLKERDVDLIQLATALSEMAPGRHLLAWSSDRELQRIWQDLHADGALDRHAVMVSVENIAANKLDYLIRPTVDIRLQPAGDGHNLRGRVSVTIGNPVLKETSPQLEGTYTGIPGAHRAMVLVHLPWSTYDLRALDEPFTELGIDGPMKVAGMRFDVLRGQSRTVRFDFWIPASEKVVKLLPSGRSAPLAVVVNGFPINDAVPRTLLWSPQAHHRGWPVWAWPVLAALLVAWIALGFVLIPRPRRELAGSWGGARPR